MSSNTNQPNNITKPLQDANKQEQETQMAPKPLFSIGDVVKVSGGTGVAIVINILTLTDRDKSVTHNYQVLHNTGGVTTHPVHDLTKASTHSLPFLKLVHICETFNGTPSSLGKIPEAKTLTDSQLLNNIQYIQKKKLTPITSAIAKGQFIPEYQNRFNCQI